MQKIQNKFIHIKASSDKLAFTLVELIVVITILAILGTIAFISLQGYSSQARDSKRVSDIQNIKKSLELFSLNIGKYPEPDDSVTESYGSQDLWYQGKIGEQVTTNLSRNLNEKPLDPLTQSEYIYSRTYGGTEYELLSIYESDLISQNNNLLNQTNATNINYPKISGNYNGVYLKAGSYYLPTPSIINALNTDLDFEETSTGLESQILTGRDNIIANAGNEASTGGLSGMTVELYTGTITEDSNDNEKIALIEVIQSAYNGSDLANEPLYADILSKTSTLEKLDFINTTVLSAVENSSSSTIVGIKSCNEILESGDSTGNGIYTIDPENNGTGFDVYCDMTTDGGGRTLVVVNNGSDTSLLNTSEVVGDISNILASFAKVSNNQINSIVQDYKMKFIDSNSDKWYITYNSSTEFEFDTFKSYNISLQKEGGLSTPYYNSHPAFILFAGISEDLPPTDTCVLTGERIAYGTYIESESRYESHCIDGSATRTPRIYREGNPDFAAFPHSTFQIWIK